MTAPTQVRPVNGLTIAGFVVSVLWLAGVGAVLAVVFCAVALRQVRARNQSGQGLAVAGLIIGIVGVVGAAIFWATVLADDETHDKFQETCQAFSADPAACD